MMQLVPLIKGNSTVIKYFFIVIMLL